MSESQIEYCPACLKVKRITGDYRGPLTNGLTYASQWCSCVKSVEKHDGNLPGRNPYIVQIIKVGVTRDVRIGHDAAFVEEYEATDEVWLSASQFLSLLDWGEQNKSAIEQMAKEQESDV